MGFRNYDEQQVRGENFDKLLRGKLLAREDKGKAISFASRELSGILRKGDVGGTASDDLFGDLDHLTTGVFLQIVEQGPAVFDLLRPFMRSAEFNVALFLGTDPLVAKIIGESAAWPVLRYNVDNVGLQPLKAGGGVVVTNESLKSVEGIESARKELVIAVAKAVDAKFLDLLNDDASTKETATANPLSDLLKLLSGVNLNGYAPNLTWVTSPAIANVLSAWRGIGDGQLLFPAMSPVGGELLNLPCLVSGALVDDLYLIDPSGVIVGVSNMEIKISDSAAIEMSDAPIMNSQVPTGATLVSMFQNELLAISAVRSFGAKLVRPSACGVLSTIAWTQEVG